MATSSRTAGGVVFWITPVPAARPRVGRWGTYYPKKYNEFRKELGRLIKLAKLPRPVRVFPISVYLEFVCPRPKKPSNPYPVGDVDNYIKAVLDSVQGDAVLSDDKQVTHIEATKRYTEEGERPHIKFHWDFMPGSSEDVLDQQDTISIEELENEPIPGDASEL